MFPLPRIFAVPKGYGPSQAVIRHAQQSVISQQDVILPGPDTFIQPCALGHRVSDEFTVPVCRIHHRELHREGDELGWWGKFSIDPFPVAVRLWQHTQLNGNELPKRKHQAVAGCAEAGHTCRLTGWRSRRRRVGP